MLPWYANLTYTGPCMRPTVLLHTADDAQAASILALLGLPQVIRCRERSELEPCCRGRSIALALIVEDSPDDDVCGVLARLTTLQPGIAGLLLTPRSDSVSLAAALEGGFAGVVQLPVDGARLMRVVGQAMERYRLQQENTRLRTLLPLYRLGEQFFSAASERRSSTTWFRRWSGRPRPARSRSCCTIPWTAACTSPPAAAWTRP